MHRIYQNISLVEHQIVTLSSPATHHLVSVLRCRVGAELVLFNGGGDECHAVITNIAKRSAQVDIKRVHTISRESPLYIHLGQVISRGEKMDLTIQKAVELGVAEITPLFSERCNVKLPKERIEKRLQHWRKVIISACEQCGRNVIPALNAVMDLSAWAGHVEAELKLIMQPAEEKMNWEQITSSVALLVGPEGGFTPAEIDCAKQQGFQAMALGPRVLRTETAGLAMVSVLQNRFGDC